MDRYWFRAKEVQIDRWVEGYYVKMTTCEGREATFITTLPGKGIMNTILVDPETVGQYTGLTDKNGKRIYEGDIVRHLNENPYANPENVELGKVYWDKEYCGWRRTSNVVLCLGRVDTYRMSHDCVYEVIGTIHDNPELLEGSI